MFTSCHNGDWEFPDYDYTAVYFAYQTPVRTIVLGEDIFDTTLDNAHKCQIIATMGGVYDNNNNIEISYRVDNSLCEGLTFDGTNSVMAMPSNYYSLSTDKFVIKKGEILGRVDVQLTDAFFADPLALKNTYVIPVVMTNVLGADSILRGTPLVANPNRAIASDWDVVPKDYILYAVKYINPWDANYLRRGKDVVTGTQNKTVVRHKQYVENDEVVRIYTGSLNTAVFPVEIRDESETLMDCKLLLTFDGSGKCTISSASDNVTISGSGSFVEKGEKNSWGNQDRNALYLNYNISFTNGLKYETVDTLVVRDRGISSETFSPELK
jgi:hypothetical protein